MKRLFFTLFIILFSSAAYSQDNSKELTDEQKEELRKNHNPSLNFSSKTKTNSNNINITSTKEQSEKEVKTTVVQYYYGKEDSLYKEFEYK